MNLDAIGFIAPQSMPSLAVAGAGAGAPGAGFGAMFSDGLAAVNGDLQAADRGLMRLAAGDAPSLHGVMIGLEEARLSFQLLVQVRNRMLEAYQDISRMQL